MIVVQNQTLNNGQLFERFRDDFSGVTDLDQDKLPVLAGMKYGSVSHAARMLGGVEKIRETFVGFQQYLYLRGGELD